MKTKLQKLLKYLAGATFLFALALNVIVTLDDPFLFMSDVAIATDVTGSNNTGSGMYFYTHLQGRPDTCTLYKKVETDGSVSYSSSEIKAGVGYTVSKISGMEEKCPNNGNGCTVYSCHETNNTNP